jgi:DNA-directed RNA polymerase specialized sigma subunit
VHTPGDGDVLPDAAESPFDLCYRCEQRDVVNRALSGLRDRERQVVFLHYHCEMSMKEIGQHK